MKKLKILFGTVILSAGLASCSSAYYASAGYASDDLYAVHDRAEISRRKQAEAEAQRAAAEARRAEWEARIAEAKAAAAENSYYEYRSADANPYESVLADDYESAYARRLRGFESPTYKMPSSYINARYGSAFNYVSAYDPAFYNIVVMGDQVWVEPKYITSMFGSWGTVIYSDPWYYGWNRPWGPSFSFGSWGWSFGWNSWHNPWYGPGWGPWYSSWYDPWYGPGWGWGETGVLAMMAKLVELGFDINKDITIKWADAPSVLEGVSKGEGDVGFLPIEYTYFGDDVNAEVVYQVGEVAENYICCRMTTSRKILEERRDDLVKVIKAEIRAYKFMQENKEETVKILAAYSGQDEEYVEQNIYNVRISFVPDPYADAVGPFYNVLGIMGFFENEEATSVDVMDHVDATLYKQALDEIMEEYPNDPCYEQLLEIYNRQNSTVQ